MKYKFLLIFLTIWQFLPANSKALAFRGHRPIFVDQVKNTNLSDSFIYTRADVYTRFFKEKISDNAILHKYGVGWRFRKGAHGFNIYGSGHAPVSFHEPKLNFSNTINTKTGAVKKFKDTSVSGTYYYLNGQLMYLYYLQPASVNSLYLGAGVEADRYAFHLKRTDHDLNMGFISGVLSGGYQFQLTNNTRTFFELQVSNPAFAWGSTKEKQTGLKPMDHWLPSVTFSVGFGF